MEALVTEVQKFIAEETRLGQAGLAKLCGLSTGVISAWIAGKYTGDVERTKVRIIGAIELYRERRARQLPETYVETDQARTVESTIMYALKHKQSGAVLAESGLGKSTAARHVSSREFGIEYVRCDFQDHRVTAFLHRLAGSIGMKLGPTSSAWKIQRELADRLTDTEWVLVIDDAHYLVNPFSPSRSPSLDIVKDLQEHAGTPFVLLGVPELWHTVQRRLDGGWYAQLRRRLGIVQHLQADRIQADDVEAIVKSLGARSSPTVLASLHELARTPGGYGNIEKSVRWATKDGGKLVTGDSLKQYLAATSNASVRVGREQPAAEGAAVNEKEMARAS